MTRHFYFFDRALSPKQMALVSAWEQSLGEPSAKGIASARSLVWKEVIPGAVGAVEVPLEEWQEFLHFLGEREPELRRAAVGALWLEAGVCSRLAEALNSRSVNVWAAKFQESSRGLSGALQWTEA